MIKPRNPIARLMAQAKRNAIHTDRKRAAKCVRGQKHRNR